MVKFSLRPLYPAPSPETIPVLLNRRLAEPRDGVDDMENRKISYIYRDMNSELFSLYSSYYTD
jgi:hypothetical protein